MANAVPEHNGVGMSQVKNGHHGWHQAGNLYGWNYKCQPGAEELPDVSSNSHSEACQPRGNPAPIRHAG